MNLLIKQKQTHRLGEQIYGYRWRKDEGKGKLGSLGLTAIFKMYNQHGPTV